MTTQPIITVRFANPQYNPSTKKYKVDVEFQSDTPNQQLFGMNVRFHYDATKLVGGTSGNGKVKLVDFQGGYGMQATAGCTTVQAGTAFFGFSAPPSTYVNWAVQLNSVSQPPIYISTTEWTKLFSVETETPTVVSGEFCPSFIWDIQSDPTKGGFAAGKNAKVEITVVKTLGGTSGATTTAPATERGIQFNWEQTSPTRPFGAPTQSNCFNI